MKQIIIEKLKDDNDTRSLVTGIFVDAYYKQFSFLSKEKEKLANAFSSSFLLHHFYGAFEGDELVGIFALSDSNERSIKVHRGDFVKNFGFLKGLWFYMIMKKELEHPVQLRKEGYLIEVVATKVAHQGKGIGKAMMQYALAHNDYLELDVVDTNTAAIKIYEKTGFKIFKEVPEKYFKKVKGFSKRIYMYFDKEETKVLKGESGSLSETNYVS